MSANSIESRLPWTTVATLATIASNSAAKPVVIVAERAPRSPVVDEEGTAVSVTPGRVDAECRNVRSRSDDERCGASGH